MRYYLKTTIVVSLLLIITSCSRQEPVFVIGVSQCSQDIWREKQNAELRMGAYINGNVELRFTSANDNDERQVQQIDSLLGTGIDLLIVAPNQVKTISPAIDRAFERGVPVIVFERKTDTKKYTAFISADNHEMGHTLGEFIAQQLKGHGRVIEIMGLKGSSPAIDRHKGFAEAMSQYPDIEVVATLQGDWTEQSAVNAVKEWMNTAEGQKQAAQGIDYVFGQNDRMAMGARKALASSRRSTFSTTRYSGIDGLPGKDGGIQLVRDSLLEASYIYPTHGDKLIQLALEILEKKPYKKEYLLKSALVTRDNAYVLQMESEEIMRQSAYLDQLHKKADNYMMELDTQRAITILMEVIIFIITISAIIIITNMRRRHRLERQAFSMVVNSPLTPQPSDISPQTSDPTPQASEPRPQITEVTPEEIEQIEGDADARFLELLRQHVQEQIGNSDFGVEELAAQMGVSRVQLYRKVKQQTGRTPVDIIRLSRLNRSKILLQTTDLSVSEIAYQVGFTAPSYFTKCFKDEFGILPGDIKKN